MKDRIHWSRKEKNLLVPAILYKDEIEKAFAKDLYTNNYFYYNGYPHCNSLPEINTEDNHYQYAIVDNHEKVIGYLSYKIDDATDTVDCFGLYSFDRGNYIIGKDLFEEMERLVKKYRRIEWKMIGGNPVKKHYDKFCKKHNGHIAVLHDVCKDPDGKYCNVYFYEIINAKH